MRSNLRTIYGTRAQCEEHGLDKVLWFYRIPNATPTAMHQGHKKELRQRFRDKYDCTHKIKFTRVVDKEYLWDIKENKAVKREGFIQ